MVYDSSVHAAVQLVTIVQIETVRVSGSIVDRGTYCMYGDVNTRPLRFEVEMSYRGAEAPNQAVFCLIGSSNDLEGLSHPRGSSHPKESSHLQRIISSQRGVILRGL